MGQGSLAAVFLNAGMAFPTVTPFQGPDLDNPVFPGAATDSSFSLIDTPLAEVIRGDFKSGGGRMSASGLFDRAEPGEDVFVRVALKEEARALAREGRLLQLKGEYLSLIPRVRELLQGEGRLTPSVEKYLGVLFDKCFLGMSSADILQKYSDNGNHESIAIHWKACGKEIIFGLVERGLILISDDLRRYLENADNSIRYTNWWEERERTGIHDPVDDLKKRIRASIVYILSRHSTEHGIEYRDEDIDRLMEKISQASLQREDSNSLQCYALMAARNWALDRIRDRERRPRIEARTKAREEKVRMEAEAEEREREQIEAVRREFKELMARFSVGDTRPLVAAHLGILYFRTFEGTSDAEMQERFPGTSRDVRDKWVQRGRKFLWPHASEELRAVLAKGMKPRKKRV